MLRILILTIVLAVTPGDAVHTQEIQNPDCAKVSVTCPEELDLMKPVKFTAKVVGGKRYGEITYNWTVTKGIVAVSLQPSRLAGQIQAAAEQPRTLSALSKPRLKGSVQP